MPEILKSDADRHGDAARPADRPMDLGVYGRGPVEVQFGGLELAAAGLSVLWLALAGSWWLGFWGTAEAALPPLLAVPGLVLPVVVIGAAALTLRTAARLRSEAASLRAAIDGVRNAQIAQQQTMALRPNPDRAPVDRLSTDRSTGRRGPAPRTPMAEEQPRLALGTPDDTAMALAAADFIRALNFPDTDQDREGFRVLRLALAYRSTAKLIRAAQDVLTLLSQEGIYMDDLPPEPAPPEVWRRFAQGERGSAIGELGGIDDHSSIALTTTRMRADPIFRDAAHHFLRQFDASVSEFGKAASDDDLNRFGDTRTARAFMLLGRVTGTFD